MSYPPGHYGGPPPDGDPYGQQPGYGPPSYGPPTDPPSSGPYGQPPPSGPGYSGAPYQQPAYGPQPGPYGQPGMPPGVPPPKRSHTGLLVGLGSGIVVLIVAIIVVAVYAFGGNGGGSPEANGSATPSGAGSPSPAATSPTQAVSKYLTAIFTDKSKSEAEAVVCSAEKDNPHDIDPATVQKDLEKSSGQNDISVSSWTTPTESSESGSTAKVKNTLKLTFGGQTAPVDVTWTLKNESGWKVCSVNT